MMRAEVGCSECVDKVLYELSNELIAPSTTELAEVQAGYGLELGALWREISRSAETAVEADLKGCP
jgi:hypothetical protein